MTLIESHLTRCPYCGEPVEVEVDPAGGDAQTYVEDCSVCCRPWVVRVQRDADDGWVVVLERQDE
jgi:hypothetical protein